jgi:hypothetical protein
LPISRTWLGLRHLWPVAFGRQTPIPHCMVDKLAAIEVLPGDVLLHLFSVCQPNLGIHEHYPPPTLTWNWHRLAHVCRRWRGIIFAYPHYLRVGLVIRKNMGSATQVLDCWPALPIFIRYDVWDAPLSRQDEDNAIAALKHSDRIRDINLPLPLSNLLEKSTIWLESFPALECLCIGSEYGTRKTFMVFPSTFLGGSTPTSHRLRHIQLQDVSIPTLPQLLLSSRDLVSLALGSGIFSDGGILPPPDAFATCLSATTQLESLHFHFTGPVSPEGETSTHSVSHPPSLVVLSALIRITFEGTNEYFEDFVSRIRAPLLKRITVHVLDLEPPQVLDISQLSQFISRTEYMRSCPVETRASLSESCFQIKLDFPLPSPLQQQEIYLEVMCDQESGGASQLVNVCRQLSPLISGVKLVNIGAYTEPTSTQDEADTSSWLKLFRQFSGAREVALSGLYGGIAHALEQSTNTGLEVFPTLCILRLCDRMSATPLGIRSFFAERRRRTGRPIIVLGGDAYQASREDSH